jgi:hypothetical protein
METQAKILQIQSPNQQSVQASPSNELIADISCDLFLWHDCADISWTTKLAERLRGAQFRNLDLRVSLADWDSTREINFWNAINKSLQCQSHLAIIVSRTMLRDEWVAVQQTVKSLIESAAAEGRVVTILKDNVTMPPPLSLCEWFDFRAEKHFEESVSDLIAFLNLSSASNSDKAVPDGSGDASQVSAKRSDSGGRLYSFGVSPAKERLLSNLFPVAELPKLIFSAETNLRTEAELTEACPGVQHLPFLVKGSRLFTIEPLSRDSAFAPAVSNWDTRKQENFSNWSFGKSHAGWAAELLKNTFRHHAWKRGLRWDSCTEQYYFPRTRPKSVWWEVSEQTIAREVTAPRMGWIELENHASAEVQYGWKHQSVRADFVQLQGNLSLRLEPSWLLTELDGKTAATLQPVGPVFSGLPQQERNGQILRSLRFWSAILAKGHHEIRMGSGHSLVRIKLTPLSGFTQFGIRSDHMDYDQLILTEMEDDLLMPALGPLGQGNIFRHEEDLSSQTLGSSRSGQPQARI